jgi:RNase P/RNase MRP subunit p29
MYPLKALRKILSQTTETISGVVVSSLDNRLIIATSQGRVVVQSSEKITPGSRVTIDGGAVRVSPSKAARYQV